MSSFSITLGSLTLCNNRAACWTNIKLSWMQRFRMKAHWFLSTSDSSQGASLEANVFATSLAKMWIRLMGR
jgi:hypothetical protein